MECMIALFAIWLVGVVFALHTYQIIYVKETRTNTIDEFISMLEKNQQENALDYKVYGIPWSDIEQVAKQMKEGKK